MKVVFITPFFNAKDNFDELIGSVRDQNSKDWVHILIDDMSTDDSLEYLQSLVHNDDRFEVISNDTKKYALRNIVDVARRYEDQEDVIIALIDGDDSLCDNNTVDYLIEAYTNGATTAWTAHSWDINGMNISKKIPENVDPYAWPWGSSHLKTFKSSLLSRVSNENFKDLDGEWFTRGYDQALMLPLLYLSSNRQYIDKTCYKYNINSVSVTDRVWVEKDQMFTINLVRARGFVS